ncbi:MAG: hypothetical protein ACPGXY_06870 [Alphaproteobacteria bacterium]
MKFFSTLAISALISFFISDYSIASQQERKECKNGQCKQIRKAFREHKEKAAGWEEEKMLLTAQVEEIEKRSRHEVQQREEKMKEVLLREKKASDQLQAVTEENEGLLQKIAELRKALEVSEQKVAKLQGLKAAERKQQAKEALEFKEFMTTELNKKTLQKLEGQVSTASSVTNLLSWSRKRVARDTRSDADDFPSLYVEIFIECIKKACRTYAVDSELFEWVHLPLVVCDIGGSGNSKKYFVVGSNFGSVKEKLKSAQLYTTRSEELSGYSKIDTPPLTFLQEASKGNSDIKFTKSEAVDYSLGHPHTVLRYCLEHNNQFMTIILMRGDNGLVTKDSRKIAALRFLQQPWV